MDDRRLYFTYPDWRRKAVTFSYDDGTVEDRRLVALFNRCGLKGTFNLAPALLSEPGRIRPAEVASLYAAHEVASHGFRHLHLGDLPPSALRAEIRDGRAALEDLLGREVPGFASPYGSHGPLVVETLREFGMAYGRPVEVTDSTAETIDDWLRWRPTCHHDNRLVERVEAFLADTGWGGVRSCLSVWGHAYEFERKGNWETMERACEALASSSDSVWSATCLELRDYIEACRAVRTTLDGRFVENLSSQTLWANFGFGHGLRETVRVLLPPGTGLRLDQLAPGVTEATGEPLPADEPLSRVVVSAETPSAASVADARAPFRWTFPGHRPKALTFSFDDGMRNDRRVVSILSSRGLRGTFNLNSHELEAEASPDAWHVARDEAASLFREHEVAVHGELHGTWNMEPMADVIRDVLRDRSELECLVGAPVTGLAYPCGQYSMAPGPVALLRATGFVHGRAVQADRSFRLPADFLRWAPTAHFAEPDLLGIGRDFLVRETSGEPLLLYIWGHSFEFRGEGDWTAFESFCDLFRNRTDVWAATNAEICAYVTAARSLRRSFDGRSVFNPTAVPIAGFCGATPVVVPPGETRFA